MWELGTLLLSQKGNETTNLRHPEKESGTILTWKECLILERERSGVIIYKHQSKTTRSINKMGMNILALSMFGARARVFQISIPRNHFKTCTNRNDSPDPATSTASFWHKYWLRRRWFEDKLISFTSKRRCMHA